MCCCWVLWCGERVVCLLGVRNEEVGVSTEKRRGVSLPGDRGRLSWQCQMPSRTALILNGLVKLPKIEKSTPTPNCAVRTYVLQSLRNTHQVGFACWLVLVKGEQLCLGWLRLRTTRVYGVIILTWANIKQSRTHEREDEPKFSCGKRCILNR